MKLDAAKRRRVEEYEKKDRISDLPEPILHHILACLPLKDATRMSCLSRTWNAAWNSSPELHFDQEAFEGIRRSKRYKPRVQQFCNYVNKSIRRRRQSNILIQKFKLHLIIRSPCDRVPVNDLNKWLNYATSCNNLDQLVVRCEGPKSPLKEMWPFFLPVSLFSVKSLKELDLEGCKIPTSNNIEFSLKRLSLTDIRVDQQTLQGMLSSNLLEQVSIKSCRGFQKLKLVGNKLEEVYLQPRELWSQSMEVESPNLQAIIYSGDIESSIAGCNCKNLKKVILDRVGFLTSNILRYIPSKFPALENLELRKCRLTKSEDNTVPSPFCIQGCVNRRQLEASDLFSFISSLETQFTFYC